MDAKDRINIWNHRENIPIEINKHQPYKADISVRTSKIPAFIQQLEILFKIEKDLQLIWFGHLADGNLHINILPKDKTNRKAFDESAKTALESLYRLTEKFEGAISAEHGIGLIKKAYLRHSRSPEEIELMRAIKRAFDPNNILNPGKIIDLQ